MATDGLGFSSESVAVWCGYCSTLGLVPVLSVARRAGARGCHLCVPWCSRFLPGSATASVALLDILLPLTPNQQKTQAPSWLMAPVPFVQWCPLCCFKISAAANRWVWLRCASCCFHCVCVHSCYIKMYIKPNYHRILIAVHEEDDKQSDCS